MIANNRTALLATCFLIATATILTGEDTIDIGRRRELFVDDYLIDTLKGARLTLHRPVPREIALVFDEQWEGNTS